MARQTTIKTKSKSGNTKMITSTNNKLSARQQYKLKKMEMKLGKTRSKTERVKTRAEVRGKTAKWDALSRGLTSASGAAGSTGVSAALSSNNYNQKTDNSNMASQAVTGGLVNASDSRDDDEGVDG